MDVINPKGLVQAVKVLVLKVCSLGCKQFFGATPPIEKSTIYLDPCRKTFEDAVDGFHEISRGVHKLARGWQIL